MSRMRKKSEGEPYEVRQLSGNPGDVTKAQLALNPGDPVRVRLDSGKEYEGQVKYGTPYRIGGDGPWVVHVTGLAGCYLLERVTPLPKPAPRLPL